MGNYYNFYAATAGSGTSDFIGEAPDSICPKGWRMVENEGEKSWINLFAEYYGVTKTGEFSDPDTMAIVSVFNFLRSGYYHWNGVLSYRSFDSRYWSAHTYSSSSHAYTYHSYSSWLYYQDGGNKGIGFSLCCVAKNLSC